ncbi:unnamed protein product [Dimorphilus gyrociliatus]|uniref:Peptidase metallopeptidase domain-containing protein n=1 Tax=Dimorphilus gyrociliatus TaxID=2664684 RepID=A0A7I8V5P3_9ANNE|nr:unnamed protein product [Dimorphilus gyrociliatus]
MVLLFAFLLVAAATAADPPVDLEEIESYLAQFAGYKKSENTLVASWETEEFNEAVKRFQREVGLEETGRLNEETLTLMKEDRCGITDGGDGDNSQDYQVWTSWFKYSPKRTLSYCITDYTKDLSPSTARRVISDAVRAWTRYGNLNIRYTSSRSCDLKMKWGVRNHGCFSPFDGRGRILAHAFYPTNGDVHFDDDEYWTDRSRSGKNLYYVSVHELGHALGIRHSRVRDSVMYPIYRSYNPNFKLHMDDINAIRKLYRKF